jgi:tetratricopeptide (TPR) repeat protein
VDELFVMFEMEGGNLKTPKNARGKLYAFPKRNKPAFDADSLFEQALKAENNGNTEGAIQLYQQAIKNDPSDAGSWVNLGTIWFHRGNYVEAIFCYMRAMDVDPEFALAYFNLANLMDEIGIQTPEAIGYYEKAIQLDPKFADAYYNLALLYRKSGQTFQSIRCWVQYLRLDISDNEWTRIAKNELQALRARQTTTVKQPGLKIMR